MEALISPPPHRKWLAKCGRATERVNDKKEEKTVEPSGELAASVAVKTPEGCISMRVEALKAD